MLVAIAKERRAHERRVAATPETVKKLVAQGLEVVVESGAGLGSSIPDEAYTAAGATIATTAAKALKTADIVLKVQRPLTKDEGGPDELALMKAGAVLIGTLSPYNAREQIAAYAAAKVDAFAMEMVPRITRAQSMDVLSSQANLAGYRAVIDAAAEFGRAFPMMMTAAGTIAPARVMVMGAGVAGLQAIATARRLGAIVSATDVRAVAKEQVESLGATFVMVDDEAAKDAETAGGYAKEMSEDYKKRQAELIAETVKKQDIVILTALIPGRPAPMLLTKEMVASMKPGSVVVDLAVEQGGNCALSEAGGVVEKHGVRIVGHLNVPSRVAVDASALYARNLLSFLTLIWDAKAGQKAVQWDDDILKAAALTREGGRYPPAIHACHNFRLIQGETLMATDAVTPDTIATQATALANAAHGLARNAADLANNATQMITQSPGGHDFFITGLTVFVLAVFVGYYVVWRVTPALHSPLMAVTNAVSSVIIVGAILAAGPADMSVAKGFGWFAVLLASINIFGGFIVTQRMLHMYRKKS